jgi:glycosyltransferase involved in cell wall biosynthesis
MRISIVMPAYNEQDNIENTVTSCFKTLDTIPGDHEVVVTDDGSKDSTGEILKRLSQTYETLVVERNEPNQGYGVALSRAIRTSKGDVVVSIDSDGQFDITELPELLAHFGDKIDILTGYRISKQDTRIKVLADRIMNLLIRVTFGVRYRDTNCAYKIYRGSTLRNMNLEASGFQIPTEIVLKAHALGLKLSESPIHHRSREGGSSALAPFKTALRMFTFLCYLRIKIALYRRGIIRRL